MNSENFSKGSRTRSTAVLAGLLVAVMAMLGSTAYAAPNPPITTAVRTLIQRVPDTYITHDGVTRRVGGMNGLVIVGDDDAYVLKSDHAGTDQTGWATFSHINDFNTPNAVTVNYTVDRKGSSEPYSLGVLKSLMSEKVDRKSTRLNSSHVAISYAVFCLKKKKK